MKPKHVLISNYRGSPVFAEIKRIGKSQIWTTLGKYDLETGLLTKYTIPRTHNDPYIGEYELRRLKKVYDV